MKKTFCDVCGDEIQNSNYYTLSIESAIDECLHESGTMAKDICPDCKKLLENYMDDIRSYKRPINDRT